MKKILFTLLLFSSLSLAYPVLPKVHDGGRQIKEIYVTKTSIYNIVVVHDEVRHATCWITTGNYERGISCIADKDLK